MRPAFVAVVLVAGAAGCITSTETYNPPPVPSQCVDRARAVRATAVWTGDGTIVIEVRNFAEAGLTVTAGPSPYGHVVRVSHTATSVTLEVRPLAGGGSVGMRCNVSCAEGPGGFNVWVQAGPPNQAKAGDALVADVVAI